MYNGGSAQVELHVRNMEETIEIVIAWEKSQSGYIGMGFTRRGIYVGCFPVFLRVQFSQKVYLRLDLTPKNI